ncbi:hypothetical protein HYU22_02530 [Candidatus Woesearchaeota archaeon]|nr:hypothetical protein [Candidatus Woesearchaeota archaeon]
MYYLSQGAGYQSGGGFQPRYSPLEMIAQGAVHYNAMSTPSYAVSSPARPVKTYRTHGAFPAPYTSSSTYTFFPQQAQTEYHFHPETFLKPGRDGKFIGKAEEIKGYVEEAFTAIFDAPFPHDIKISVCSENEFRNIAPHPSTIGLSLNRREQGLISEIFVLNDSLGRVLLTVGHELGHVLTKTLHSSHDEEAKAYAFSLAWMNVIREKDIAGLSNAIIAERPAENGLHNVAFFFVEKLIREGKRAWEVYVQIIQKMIFVPTASSYSWE